MNVTASDNTISNQVAFIIKKEFKVKKKKSLKSVLVSQKSSSIICLHGGTWFDLACNAMILQCIFQDVPTLYHSCSSWSVNSVFSLRSCSISGLSLLFCFPIMIRLCVRSDNT